MPFPVSYGMPIELGTVTLPAAYVWIVVAALVLMVVLHLFLKKSRLGLAVRTVAGNKDIAYLMGINVPLTISVIFGLACALGAAAGSTGCSWLQPERDRATATASRLPVMGLRTKILLKGSCQGSAGCAGRAPT